MNSRERSRETMQYGTPDCELYNNYGYHIALLGKVTQR